MTITIDHARNATTLRAAIDLANKADADLRAAEVSGDVAAMDLARRRKTAASIVGGILISMWLHFQMDAP